MTALTLFWSVAGNVARADSDGYYCTDTGYLAVQFRSALTAGLSEPHVLRIIRFGEAGLSVGGEVKLPDFQPHKLVCSSTQVRVGGWMGRPVEYVIDVTGTPKVEFEVSNPGQTLQGTVLKNLGAWARPQAVDLPSSDRRHGYRLVTTVSKEKSASGLIRRVRTIIEMTDVKGDVVDSLELYNGVAAETVD